MFEVVRRFTDRLLRSPRLLHFRLRRALAIRRARRDDTNNYPMW